MGVRLLLLALLCVVFAVDSQAAAANVESINNYVDTVEGLLNDKLKVITITLIMMFSALMAWRNASPVPLGWGAAASILVGGSDKVADGLKNLNF